MVLQHKNDHHTKLSTSRMEAFSDGVIAIIITITVLEFRVPAGGDLASLLPLWPLFVAYLISFQNIGTYWNNHHYLLSTTDHISPGMMWANLHLLFWLSFIPFATGWLGENHGSAVPTAVYATILFFCAVAYTILQLSVLYHADNKEMIEEIRKSKKGRTSLLFYLAAIPLAFLSPLISDVLIILVSALWFIPDRRLERFL